MTLQTLGPLLGGVAAAGGFAWVIAQLFIFGNLAPIFNVEIGEIGFADNAIETVLVEARFVNRGKTRLKVKSIAYAPFTPIDWSAEGRKLALNMLHPYSILIGETTYAPGEGQEALLVLPWQPKTRVMPVFFEIKYVDALDYSGVRSFLMGLLGRRGEPNMKLFRIIAPPQVKGV